MAELIVMPKLGLTMKEGKVGKWLKNEGDFVKKGEPLLEVATDKLTNEVEATAEGILLKIIAPQGSVIPCLKGIAVIGAAGEDFSSLLGDAQSEASSAPKATTEVVSALKVEPASASSGKVKASPAAKKLATSMGIDIGLVVGTGPEGRVTVEDVENFDANKVIVKASPMAVKTAEALNVNLGDIQSNQRIMKDDVTAYHGAKTIEALAAPMDTKAEMSQMRKVISERMTMSWQTSPAVTYDIKINMGALMKLKSKLASLKKITITDMLVKLASTALLEFPLLNSTIEGDTLITRNYTNIGVAVALTDGLIVPVVKYTNIKGISAISDEIKELADKARRGALTTDQMQGGTFTISNLGMFGMDAFSPIINQPEVAILGVNTIEDELKMISGEVVAIKTMKLSLTADHRAVDGAVAAQFLKRLKDLMECPEQLLL